MVQSVHKVVIRSYFSVIQRHKGSKVLVVSPRVRMTAIKGKLRLIDVAYW